MQNARVTLGKPPCCSQNLVAVTAPWSLRTTAVAVYVPLHANVKSPIAPGSL
jgi:hypothetical protein